MLTNELRPTDWKGVVGQKDTVRVLKAILKNPSEAPKTIILEGDFGSGKTTSARIFARELNNIKDPNYDVNNSPFYFEYDSTVIGNVDKIRELRDVFAAGSGNYWKVIVFDETHACSVQAQTALLKVLEEGSVNTFYMMCTTHAYKLIPTILSRSLVLSFSTIDEESVFSHLEELEGKLGMRISDDIKDVIISRAEGHMRNVHMLVDRLKLIGEEDFKASVRSSIDLFCDYFYACKAGNNADVLKSINALKSIDMASLKSDFTSFVYRCLLCSMGEEVRNRKIKEVATRLGNDSIMKITQQYFSDWFRHVFTAENAFQAGMLYFYQLFREEDKKNVSNPSGGATPVNRNRIR